MQWLLTFLKSFYNKCNATTSPVNKVAKACNAVWYPVCLKFYLLFELWQLQVAYSQCRKV